jgi:hypothetical protein
MSQREFREALRERLRAQPYPLLATRDACGLTLLAGASLWSTVVEQARAWKHAGARPGDVLIDSPAGFRGVVHILASLAGGYVYQPTPARAIPRIVTPADPVDTERRVFCVGPGAVLERIAPPTEHLELGSLTADTALLLAPAGADAGLVALEYRALHDELTAHAAALGFECGSSRLALLPWNRPFGLVLDLLLGLWASQVIWIQPRTVLRPRNLAQFCRSEQIDCLAAVPRMVDLLLAGLGPAGRLDRLTVHAGGAAISAGLRRLGRAHFGRWIEESALQPRVPKHASAIKHRISNMMLAPTSAVLPV